jgi:hypothetical protein
MGNSGGTTDVMIKMQSKSSFPLAIPRSSPVDELQSPQIAWHRPLTQTYELAAMAKINRNPMNKNASKVLAETRSVEKIMVRTS